MPYNLKAKLTTIKREYWSYIVSERRAILWILALASCITIVLLSFQVAKVRYRISDPIIGFNPRRPSLISAYLYNFFHKGWDHLYDNLLGFWLGILLLLFFSIMNKRPHLSLKLLLILITGVPFIDAYSYSILCYFCPYTYSRYLIGFSNIIGSLYGAVLFIGLIEAYEYEKSELISCLSSLLISAFIFSYEYVSVLLSSFSLALAIILLIISKPSMYEELEFSERIKRMLLLFAKILLVLIPSLVLLYGLFPPISVVRSNDVNVLSHFISLIVGAIIALLVSSLNKQS